MKEFRKEATDRLTKIEIVIENDIKPDIKASLEGYQMVYEKQGVGIRIIKGAE